MGEQPLTRHGTLRDPVGWIVLVSLTVLAHVMAGLIGPVTVVSAALVLGVLTGNLTGFAQRADAAGAFMLKRVLKIAVVLLGAGVSTDVLAQLDVAVVATIAVIIIVAVATAMLVGRLVGLGFVTGLLIAVGTAICGASAIAAAAPIVKASREEITYALSTIFMFNAAALVALPLIAVSVQLDPVVFGMWAGMAVHDTAAAVATGFTYTANSGEVATVVKLTRTVFLIPVIVIIALVAARRDAVPSGQHALTTAGRSFPLFVLGFIATATANTWGLFGDAGALIADVGRLMIVGVVAAVGLTLHLRKLRGVGTSLLITGLTASVTVAMASLALIAFVNLTT